MDQDELDPRENGQLSSDDVDATLAVSGTVAPAALDGEDAALATDVDGNLGAVVAAGEVVAAAAATPEGEEAAPVRPREIIRGIHPELLCTCEECEPDHVELQWFNVDETKKVKGTAMLFCGYSSRKYFTPVPDLQAFLTANPVKPVGRKAASTST
jgi:hypothetical protein